jgi:hypothetical protein
MIDASAQTSAVCRLGRDCDPFMLHITGSSAGFVPDVFLAERDRHFPSSAGERERLRSCFCLEGETDKERTYVD